MQLRDYFKTTKRMNKSKKGNLDKILYPTWWKTLTKPLISVKTSIILRLWTKCSWRKIFRMCNGFESGWDHFPIRYRKFGCQVSLWRIAVVNRLWATILNKRGIKYIKIKKLSFFQSNNKRISIIFSIGWEAMKHFVSL